MKKVCIAALLFGFSSLTLAQSSVPPLDPSSTETSVCGDGFHVYYGNGILTESSGANASMNLVREALGERFSEMPMSYFVSYNPTEGVLLDLLEAFAQKLAEDPTLTWQLFFRWVSGWAVGSSLQVMLADYFGADGAHRIAQAAGQLAGPQAYTDPTVVAHVQNYRSALLAGKRVMVVAHSQGNLYANAAYGMLASTHPGDYDLSAFGIAGFASPANLVATGDGYVTSDTDLVIDAVRVIAPATLLENDSSVPPFAAGCWYGHCFDTIYMGAAYPGIRAHSLSVMHATLARLASVSTSAATGPITATLTWDVPGDLDLHAHEPSAHVYYANRYGQVGYLDRDDTNGTGPEHYYASCDGFQAGNYRFGVNYYRGSGSREATVQLSVGGVTYPARAVILNTARGASGNSEPVTLFSVNVEEDGSGGYRATLQ